MTLPRRTSLLTVLAVVAAASCRGDADHERVHPSVAAAVAAAREKHPERFRRKVVLLGFDSCDPDLVEDYVRAGHLPNFARLMREGAHGVLKSIQPTLSPVVWTTIATGMSPERHGILDFVQVRPDGTQTPFTSKQRQADMLWELLSYEGEKVGAVGWLATWPADPVNGFVVTERQGMLAFEYGESALDTTHGRTWPADLTARIADDTVAASAIPLSAVRTFVDVSENEFRATASDTFNPINPVGNLRLTLATAETFRNVGQRLLAEEKPRFFACYFEAMDAISHMFMQYAPPKDRAVDKEKYLKYRTAMDANYIWHDQVLGEFLDMADPDTTVIVVSDHGFKSGDLRLAESSDFHAKTGAMWHRPYGVVYAWGNGVRAGAKLNGASVYDVAPTVLAAMGYPVSEEMRGRVLEAAFEGGLDAERVPTYRDEARRDDVAAARAAEADSEEPLALGPDEEAAMKRLEAIGYIGKRGSPATTVRNRVISLLTSGRAEAAWQALQELIVRPDATPDDLTLGVQIALRRSRLDDAERLLAQSEAIERTYPQNLYFRAYVELSKKNFDAALASAREAVRAKPDGYHNHMAVAAALEAMLRAAEERRDVAEMRRLKQSVIEAYEAALRLEPREASLLHSLAKSRLATLPGPEDLAAAKAELDRALEMSPDWAVALCNRSVAELMLGARAKQAGDTTSMDTHFAAALADADRAIALAEDGRYGKEYKGYAVARANRAYVLWQTNRVADAAAEARRVMDADPQYRLNPQFVAALAGAGHTLAVSAPK